MSSYADGLQRKGTILFGRICQLKRLELAESAINLGIAKYC
jgi:hypothetical protein